MACPLVSLFGMLIIEMSLLVLRIFPAVLYLALLVKQFEHPLHNVPTDGRILCITNWELISTILLAPSFGSFLAVTFMN